MKRRNMTNSYLLVLLFGVLLAGFTSCNMNCLEGEGPVVSATRDVIDFSRLEVNVPAEVTVLIGSEPAVRIEAQKNVIEVVSAKVNGSTLVIKSSPCVSTDEVFRISVTTDELSAISVNGSGTVTSQGMLKTNKMSIQINGSGDARITVDADHIDAGINGSGDIYLNGTAKDLEVGINGSGDVKGRELNTMNADVNINGSGDVEVKVSEKLSVDIAGSGNVRYSGNPNVKSSVKGSGEVSNLN
jgi:hypothetical protein